MPPPPVFTRHGLPQNFDFRPAGGAVRVTTESGLTRLVNSTRYKTRTIRSILFADTGPDSVPREPDPKHLREIGRTELNPIESRIKHLLDHERPVWTRLALLNQLSRDDLKFVSKYVTFVAREVGLYLDLFCFVSATATSRYGPWSVTRSRMDLSETSSSALATIRG